MPANKHYLKRILAIERELRTGKKFTNKQLQKICTLELYPDTDPHFDPEEDKEMLMIHEKTLQNDLNSMREEFEAPINKGRYKQYTDSDYSLVSHLLKNETGIHQNIVKLYQAYILFSQFDFFSVVDEVWESIFNLKKEFKRKGLERKHYIELDINRNVKGLDKIDELLEAVINQKKIKMEYKGFGKDAPETYELEPYMIKEYRDIWYLVAFDSRQHHNVRNYALDRITDFEILNETFDSVPINRDRYFEHTIGIWSTPKQPVKVKLRVKAGLAPYFEHKPMMPDMQKVEATEDHAIFEFTAKPTLDLQNEILWWGEGLEVLEPESLRSDMIRRMEEMREYYQ